MESVGKLKWRGGGRVKAGVHDGRQVFSLLEEYGLVGLRDSNGAMLKSSSVRVVRNLLRGMWVIGAQACDYRGSSGRGQHGSLVLEPCLVISSEHGKKACISDDIPKISSVSHCSIHVENDLQMQSKLGHHKACKGEVLSSNPTLTTTPSMSYTSKLSVSSNEDAGTALKSVPRSSCSPDNERHASSFLFISMTRP